MVVKTNMLDEAVIKTTTKGKALKKFEKKQKKFMTSKGIIDPNKAGYAITYVDGEDISPSYLSITEMLVWKVAGLKIINRKLFLRGGSSSFSNSPPVVWEVDGMMYKEEPLIDINNIKDIHILKSLAATNSYGSFGAGGVIVVRTKLASFDIEEKKKKIVEQYTNKETYDNDAIIINNKILFTNPYTNTLRVFKDKQKAFDYYKSTLKKKITDFSTHLNIAIDFNTYYKDRELSLQVLDELTITYNNNPEILKTIAYQLQVLNAKKEAIKVYQLVFKLRPNYAQSYRDLANAYCENSQYQRAWRLYMNYLLKGNDANGEGIGQLLYNEMEWLYFNRNNQSSINVQFVPKSEDIKDFRNDVRLVFEWNTSEAEFDLEFVNGA